MTTKQITVRLPVELVDFVDDHIGNGSTKSRASYLSVVLAKAKREEQAQRDAAIYAEHGEDPEVAAFSRATYAANFGEGSEVPPEDRNDFRRMHPFKGKKTA